MSTFLGLVEDIPGISVDRFDGENLGSSAFFLSHCHTDHTCGLDKFFFDRLQSKNQFLYCTELSKLFLSGKLNLTETQREAIRTVVPCSPIIVDYVADGERNSVSVVCVNAGHCPGSVMFIFEQTDLLILYTGDFRIHPNDLPRLKPLHDADGFVRAPKKFNKIYLDTTFFSPDYKNFPTRRDSVSEINRIAADWLARDLKNIVVLECSALYGSEFLFLEMSEFLKKLIHVRSCVYEDFSRIPFLEKCITDDGKVARIHACMSKRQKGGLQCRSVDSQNILTIVPSAYRWRTKDLSFGISEWDPLDDKRFYVCLSMHPSYNEIRAFVDYFHGAKFVACVEQSNNEGCVQNRLDEITKKAVDVNFSSFKPYNLESLKRKGSVKIRGRVKSRYFSDDSSD